MSVVAKRLPHSPFHSPHRQWQQQQATRFVCYNHEALNRKQTAKAPQKQQATDKEKLQLLLQQAGVIPTKTAERTQSTKYKSPSLDVEKTTFSKTNLKQHASSETKDVSYGIYQNGQIDEIFHEHAELKSPKNVADICLENDRLMLGKMPNQKSKSVSGKHLEAFAAPRSEFRALKEKRDNYLKETEKEKKKLCRYFRDKRTRVTKIAPIHEEPEDLNSDNDHTPKATSKLYCLKLQSCWKAHEHEMETYRTRTKIIKRIANPSCDRKKLNEPPSPAKVPEGKIQKPRDIQTISGSVLKSSLQHQVSLRKYGSLIECQLSDSNDDNNNNKGNENKSPLPTNNNNRRRKCPRLTNFLGLLRPFRGKYRQPKPKIEAVVYKTYFVKWTKPPDTLTHGYGVKPLKSSYVERSVLRRCRSAIF